ncbi:hypothetical protein QBC47DRAFT_200778 [Echria macrotheca]|uniref:Uncharacterized protein n=1 Tax=Echria macrotheca TaxID=438768 RepID=A0AAJ0FC98_9PEZI|nr:hypothetical protein QBC47DRAFT_200778 [Echria macrotheca]
MPTSGNNWTCRGHPLIVSQCPAAAVRQSEALGFPIQPPAYRRNVGVCRELPNYKQQCPCQTARVRIISLDGPRGRRGTLRRRVNSGFNRGAIMQIGAGRAPRIQHQARRRKRPFSIASSSYSTLPLAATSRASGEAPSCSALDGRPFAPLPGWPFLAVPSQRAIGKQRIAPWRADCTSRRRVISWSGRCGGSGGRPTGCRV